MASRRVRRILWCTLLAVIGATLWAPIMPRPSYVRTVAWRSTRYDGERKVVTTSQEPPGAWERDWLWHVRADRDPCLGELQWVEPSRSDSRPIGEPRVLWMRLGLECAVLAALGGLLALVTFVRERRR